VTNALSEFVTVIAHDPDAAEVTLSVPFDVAEPRVTQLPAATVYGGPS
jgi:hypothetical protein